MSDVVPYRGDVTAIIITDEMRAEMTSPVTEELIAQIRETIGPHRVTYDFAHMETRIEPEGTAR